MPRCPNPRCQADYPEGTLQCTNPLCQCLLPEAVVAGRYRIETLIGMGGMGAVYRASDTFEMTQVALKVLSLVNSNVDLDTAIERFRREARYAHQLRHKNIVPVLNFGQDGTLLFIAMPLVTGGTLKDLLKAELPLPTQQAQRYINDLADAIDAIHNHPQQIVHRDIKPSNLLIHQDDGRLVVTDFGIARAMQQEKPLTQRGWTLGTEHYIAPEQEQGKAETASDIYSMGVIAYQMFTGLLPFQAVVRNKAARLPSPSELNIALPPSVDPVILRAMEIDPHKRFATGREFADALNEALEANAVWSEPTIVNGLVATSSANIVIRTVIPENPCGNCGHENRPQSRFCRYCGHNLDDTSPLVTDVCQVGYDSDTGKQARENEDMLLVIQGLCVTLSPPPRPFSLTAVADGLRGAQGKTAGGHEASRLAIETISDILLPQLTTITQGAAPYKPTQQLHSGKLSRAPYPDSALEEWLRDSVQQANRVIYHCNADYDTNMASTLTTALLYKHRVYVASVGDSRAYYYNARDQQVQRLTRDHTLAANLVEADLMRPEEVYQSAKRYQRYRYLGKDYHVQVDLFQQEIETGDLIVLCTNGLWHMVRDDRLQSLLAHSRDLQVLAHTLVEEANNAGGEGNASVVVVRAQ
jgi:serine/threonine protein kinase